MTQQKQNKLLQWALIFFIIAMLSAFLGYVSLTSAAAGIAQLLFVIFFILFIAALLIGIFKRDSSIYR